MLAIIVILQLVMIAILLNINGKLKPRVISRKHWSGIAKREKSGRGSSGWSSWLRKTSCSKGRAFSVK
ncbi:hypothetical protein M4D52_12385 [Paenibacillus lactis]|uniref:hypothetical protein n=1 Tax=Paenibacillus lactis TaxID=228574 RepID=UPI00203B3D21|nr:hypothetical protein [Paenibacillus lactis]MCM3494230.1 hypothetical protein [Paenibacillus lactis]